MPVPVPVPVEPLLRPTNGSIEAKEEEGAWGGVLWSARGETGPKAGMGGATGGGEGAWVDPATAGITGFEWGLIEPWAGAPALLASESANVSAGVSHAEGPPVPTLGSEVEGEPRSVEGSGAPDPESAPPTAEKSPNSLSSSRG